MGIVRLVVEWILGVGHCRRSCRGLSPSTHGNGAWYALKFTIILLTGKAHCTRLRRFPSRCSRVDIGAEYTVANIIIIMHNERVPNPRIIISYTTACKHKHLGKEGLPVGGTTCYCERYQPESAILPRGSVRVTREWRTGRINYLDFNSSG